MQNKASPQRYFDKEKAGSPISKKQKLQKKQNQGGSSTGTKASQLKHKKKLGTPKEKGNKRKLEEIIKENGNGPAKKMKIAFSGTASLQAKKNAKKNQDQDIKSSDMAVTGEQQSNRSQRRRMKSQFKRKATQQNLSVTIDKIRDGDTSCIEKINAKIVDIKSRDTLTNSARKKLRKLQSILKLASAPLKGIDTGRGLQEKKKQKILMNQGKKPKKPPVKQSKEEEGESSEEVEDSDYDADIAIKPDKVAKEMKEESDEEEESIEEEDENDEDAEEESVDEEASDEQDDHSDDDEDVEEEESEEEEEEEIPKKTVKTLQKPQNKQDGPPQKGKSRYIVFVGNLPYNIEKPQIMEHFKKVGEIQDIRIATDPKTNKGRGFAYVEVKTEESYQAALVLHNTFIGGRKINVQYTQGGKKKGENAKKEIKAKNLKLQAMKKQGRLAGGKNPSQKRAERRVKQGMK